MAVKYDGLWQNSDFLKLWGSQIISTVGSKITFLALPLVATVTLQATAIQMGYLAAIGSLPGLLLGLFAGVWIDREKRRPLLIAADIGRGLLLLVIPLAAYLGFLNMLLLYAVIFLTGTLGLLFSISSYLPSLVPRPQLVEANSKLAVSSSAAEIVGPTLGGWLVQALGAPIAMGFDAASFLISALCLGLIRKPEPRPKPLETQTGVWREIGEGLRLIWHQPTLRALTMSISTVSFFNAALEAVYLLYMTRNLNLAPSLIGLIFGVGSLGFLLGALLPARMSKQFSLGGTIIGGLFLTAALDFILPLAAGPQLFIVALLMSGQICFGLGLTLFNVGQMSLRQAVTPDELQGRMNSTINVAVGGAILLGALVGGVLGERIGLRPTLLAAASGELLSVLWLIFSPVRTIHQPPT
jgi:MFS family permease